MDACEAYGRSPVPLTTPALSSDREEVPMKKLLALAITAAAITAGGAHANGSPYSPGLVYGWAGVGAQNSGVRFVAFGMPKSTIAAAVRARDGHVVRST